MASYEECIVESAAVIMDRLCGATGAKQGASAFQYFLPQKLDVWSLSISGGNGAGLPGCAVKSLLMRADVKGQFGTVEGAQRFALQVASVIPLRDSGPVESFHMVEPPSFECLAVKMAQADREALVYRVTVPCEVAITLPG